MRIFLVLLLKILPLYALIILGYLAGKKLKARKETIASILIYVITPVVIFNSVYKTKLTPELLLLPVIFFILCCSISMFFYFSCSGIFKDSTRNILAFAAGTANTGYFGIPVAIELFGEELIGVFILGIMGFVFFENSLGFFITARGNHTVDEALKRLFRLPTIYAFLAGLLFNFLNIDLGHGFNSFSSHFIGCYAVLGMMLIGLGLSDMKEFTFDFKFLAATFLAKFVVWPLLVIGLIFFDSQFFHLFNSAVYKASFLISIVPLAANTVAFATELKAQPEKASMAVFLSTLFGLFYIPLLCSFM